jgi:hypothetical protein
MTRRITIWIVVLLVGQVVGCGTLAEFDFDEDDGCEEAVGPLPNADIADFFTQQIADDVVPKILIALATGSINSGYADDYSMDSVSGSAGEALVTGTQSAGRTFAGSSSVTDRYSADVAIDFENFRTIDSTQTLEIDGRLNYVESSTFTTSGAGGSSSSNRIEITGTAHIKFTDSEFPCANWNIDDTLTIDVEGENVYDLSGTVASSAGETFTL